MSDEPQIVTRRTHTRVLQLGSVVGAQAHTRVAWQPNLIDYRHSLVRVFKRQDAGETVEECAHCGCETDVTPAPHWPRCKVVAPKVWGRESMLAAIRAHAASHHGAPPYSTDWENGTSEHPALKQVCREFGTWNRAVAAAGLKPRSKRSANRGLEEAGAEPGPDGAASSSREDAEPWGDE